MLATWIRAPTAAMLAALCTVAAGAGVWRLIDQGNAELARFVAALGRDDYSQSFLRAGRGASFDRLGAAFEQAMARLRAERASTINATRFAETLADSAPVALLLVEGDGVTRFANRAARRLFARGDACSPDELARMGGAFARAVLTGAGGTTQLAHLQLGGLPQRVAIDVTAVDAPGQPPRRVVAVKVIQAELDGAELAAQVDLVRVLTHEIMNSLTPVTSLAQTAAAAVEQAGELPALADARLATAALARRARALEHFVGSYRQFSQAPSIAIAAIDPAAFLADLLDLFRATPAGRAARVTVDLAPDTPPIRGDAGLLMQVFLNLLKNAGEAVENAAESGAAEPAVPEIAIEAHVAGADMLHIVIRDNGPGIPAGIARDVFLPFFTTKRHGTGIGLSFSRQVILLHAGQIGVRDGPGGCIEVTLPLLRAR